MNKVKSLFGALAALTFSIISCHAQEPSSTIDWSVSVQNLSQGEYIATFSGRIAEGWHTYNIDDEFSPSEISFEGSQGLVFKDEAQGSLGDGSFIISRKFTSSRGGTLRGSISWRSCKGEECRSPEDWDFELRVGASAGGRGLLAMILEALLWGLAMLLTPCVFPMVPMTVSFFIKSNGSRARARLNAAVYGLFIVLLYTVPICLIIASTWLLGGKTVTADIFNWLSTHWIPNLFFFIVFMGFAASLFGAFEITLPSKWVNKSNGKGGTDSVKGIFFLALTLVLVSFSCTGPIVGTVLIKSTGGEFWAPMVTMLAFSIAFALPFTVLAFFPSLLKSLPKSGEWLESVKVSLGFIEVALGLKFLSTIDQTYHWGILPRPVYLAIWIICALLLGIYLLRRGGVTTKVFGAAALCFALYLGSGYFAPTLKALSGYLPPVQTEEGGNTLDASLERAALDGRPIFLDISGYGCVNCREMEAKVLSDSRVAAVLNEKFVVVTVYTDDKTVLPESRWLTTPSGKVLKDAGRVNSYIVRERYGIVSQPAYIILGPDGKQRSKARGYGLDVDDFLEFLDFPESEDVH